MSDIDGYFQIRSDVLAYYWRGCRDKMDERHEDVLAWMIHEFDGAYVDPFELLMFCVVALGLCGSWSVSASSHLRSTAERIIFEFDSRLPLSLLAADEADELVSDIRVLGIGMA
ncbi:hypothetical protein L2Y96_21185 [Luteibacter aegosomaticola]|uniref:hypothetical protein n=1 Tax=Luteibacter aegosomaticola TaxID=2911538 RepID=UPI001FF73FCA|nr:hypothetical protein [Luteibacter aegosomaticola]UPG89872.1 hypothetical protein L2Y96_21185 [Luteibacter aegosomaticola]